MKRMLLAALMLGLCGCSTGPKEPAVGAGFDDQLVSANRWRISYDGPKTLTQKEVEDRALAHAAQLTLDKGDEWFEIKDQASGDHKRTLEILIGKGETLAGGTKQYDAKKTLAELKAKSPKSSKTS